MAEVQSLVGLGAEDVPGQRGVVGLGRQPQGYIEPLLGEDMLGGVERRPACQVCQLAGSGEHLLPCVLVGESAVEVAGDVGSEVGHECGPAVCAATALFALGEQLCHFPDCGHVVRADMPRSRRLPCPRRSDGVLPPAVGRQKHPREGEGCTLEGAAALQVQVGPPEIDKLCDWIAVPSGQNYLLIRVLEPDVGSRDDPVDTSAAQPSRQRFAQDTGRRRRRVRAADPLVDVRGRHRFQFLGTDLSGHALQMPGGGGLRPAQLVQHALQQGVALTRHRKPPSTKRSLRALRGAAPSMGYPRRVNRGSLSVTVAPRATFLAAVRPSASSTRTLRRSVQDRVRGTR